MALAKSRYYIPSEIGDICVDCGAPAEHICLNGRFPSCFACTAEWHKDVLYGRPGAPTPDGGVEGEVLLKRVVKRGRLMPEDAR